MISIQTAWIENDNEEAELVAASSTDRYAGGYFDEAVEDAEIGYGTEAQHVEVTVSEEDLALILAAGRGRLTPWPERRYRPECGPNLDCRNHFRAVAAPYSQAQRGRRNRRSTSGGREDLHGRLLDPPLWQQARQLLQLARHADSLGGGAMDPRTSLLMLGADNAQAREFGHLIPHETSDSTDAHVHAVTLERDYNPALQADFDARIQRALAALDGDEEARRPIVPPYRPDAPLWTDLHLAIARRMTREEIRRLTDEGSLPGFQIPDSESDYYYLQDDVRDWMAGTGPARTVPPHDNLHRTYVIDLPLCSKTVHDGRPCVYVGQSWYGPRERFLRHLVGRDQSRSVWKWGTRLLADLYEDRPGLETRDASEAQERDLAAQLQSAGYSVHGGN